MKYNRELKKKLCEDICINHASTLKTANEYNIPIKTLEKWITAFNKDNHCFDPVIEIVNNFSLIDKPDFTNYNNLSNEELKTIIMKKDIEITRLKKAYTVQGGGMKKRYSLLSPKKIRSNIRTFK